MGTKLAVHGSDPQSHDEDVHQAVVLNRQAAQGAATQASTAARDAASVLAGGDHTDGAIPPADSVDGRATAARLAADDARAIWIGGEHSVDQTIRPEESVEGLRAEVRQLVEGAGGAPVGALVLAEPAPVGAEAPPEPYADWPLATGPADASGNGRDGTDTGALYSGGRLTRGYVALPHARFAGIDMQGSLVLRCTSRVHNTHYPWGSNGGGCLRVRVFTNGDVHLIHTSEIGSAHNAVAVIGTLPTGQDVEWALRRTVTGAGASATTRYELWAGGEPVGTPATMTGRPRAYSDLYALGLDVAGGTTLGGVRPYAGALTDGQMAAVTGAAAPPSGYPDDTVLAALLDGGRMEVSKVQGGVRTVIGVVGGGASGGGSGGPVVAVGPPSARSVTVGGAHAPAAVRDGALVLGDTVPGTLPSYDLPAQPNVTIEYDDSGSGDVTYASIGRISPMPHPTDPGRRIVFASSLRRYVDAAGDAALFKGMQVYEGPLDGSSLSPVPIAQASETRPTFDDPVQNTYLPGGVGRSFDLRPFFPLGLVPDGWEHAPIQALLLSEDSGKIGTLRGLWDFFDAGGDARINQRVHAFEQGGRLGNLERFTALSRLTGATFYDGSVASGIEEKWVGYSPQIRRFYRIYKTRQLAWDAQGWADDGQVRSLRVCYSEVDDPTRWPPRLDHALFDAPHSAAQIYDGTFQPLRPHEDGYGLLYVRMMPDSNLDVVGNDPGSSVPADWPADAPNLTMYVDVYGWTPGGDPPVLLRARACVPTGGADGSRWDSGTVNLNPGMWPGEVYAVGASVRHNGNGSDYAPQLDLSPHVIDHRADPGMADVISGEVSGFTGDRRLATGTSTTGWLPREVTGVKVDAGAGLKLSVVDRFGAVVPGYSADDYALRADGLATWREVATLPQQECRVEVAHHRDGVRRRLPDPAGLARTNQLSR